MTEYCAAFLGLEYLNDIEKASIVCTYKHTYFRIVKLSSNSSIRNKMQ